MNKGMFKISISVLQCSTLQIFSFFPLWKTCEKLKCSKDFCRLLFGIIVSTHIKTYWWCWMDLTNRGKTRNLNISSHLITLVDEAYDEVSSVKIFLLYSKNKYTHKSRKLNMKIENPTRRLNAHISTKTANSGGNCVGNFMRRERWKISYHWFVSFPTFLFDIFHLSMIARSFMEKALMQVQREKSWSCSFTRSTQCCVHTAKTHWEFLITLCNFSSFSKRSMRKLVRESFEAK